MSNTKYGHLVNTDFVSKGIQKISKPRGKEYAVWLMGKDLDGLNVNLGWGANYPVGKRSAPQDGMHVHPFDECLLFSGLDYNNPGSLSAEIEIDLGENSEKYIFNTPTTVIVPKGVPHSSPIARQITNNYAFGIISLDGEHETRWLPEKNTPKAITTDLKYRHLVKNLNMRDAHRKSGGNADIIAGFGGKTLEGLNLNFTWAFHTGLGDWHPRRDPHVHPYGEILVFVGLDPKNPSYLGAEIEIGMGAEMEKYIFDTPTIVAVPGGLVHCPLVTRRVEKPYGFSAICLNGEHNTTWLGPDRDIPFKPGGE